MSARLDTLSCDGHVVHRWWSTEYQGMDDELLSRLSPSQRASFDKLDGELRIREWSTARRGEFALQDHGLKKTNSVFSVAHCPGAVIVVGSSEVQGLGVDVEPAERSLTPLLLQRIINPTEASYPLTPLQWWTAKEALYKCSPRAGGHLSDYRITEFSPETLSGSAQIDQEALFFQILNVEKFISTLAWR